MSKETIEDIQIGDHIIDKEMTALHKKNIIAQVTEVCLISGSIVADSKYHKLHYPHRFYDEERGIKWDYHSHHLKRHEAAGRDENDENVI